jgi:tyrosinase
MLTLSRRALLAVSALGGLIPSVVLDIRRAGAANRVRHDLTSADGQKMLKIYADGVKQMMALPERDPRGWLFQWYTHAVRSDRTKASEITRVYGAASSPEKQLAQDTWSTCQPHFPPYAEDFFLPWHRMFVLCLEQIVRQITKEDSFTLPYWNYTDVSQRALPAEFRKQGDPTWGSLYRKDRNNGVNTGTPIDKLPGALPIDLNAMKLPTYGGAGFCSSLDNDPHGSVHSDVGNSVGMGRVPWAANDPIFWMHHCNIDRIWASWNKAGGKNPSLTGSYTFADRDGKKIQLDVSKFLDTASQGYEYDKYLPRSPGSTPFPPERQLVAFAVHATTKQVSGALSLGAAAVTVKLTAAAAAPGALAPAVAPNANLVSDSLKAVPADKQFVLTLENVRATAEVGAGYDVYYGLPEGQSPNRESPAYVGSVSFFGVAPHGDDHAMADMPGRSISFVITQPVRQTLDAAPAAAASVTLVPTNAPAAGSMPTIGSISLLSA